jgi:hypothetical protein
MPAGPTAGRGAPDISAETTFAIRPPRGKAAAARRTAPGPKLQSRVVFREVVEGKEVLLIHADPAPSRTKPPRMIAKFVDGVMEWSLFPRVKVSRGRHIVVGGVFTRYDRNGNFVESTTWDGGEGMAVAATKRRSGLMAADALLVQLGKLIGPRALHAQDVQPWEPYQMSCAELLANGFRTAVVADATGGLLGIVSTAIALVSIMDCASTTWVTGMKISCPACTETIVGWYVWIDDWGNENWEPETDVYCPPCGSGVGGAWEL